MRAKNGLASTASTGVPHSNCKPADAKSQLSISFLRAKFFYAVTQIPLDDEYENILVNSIAMDTEATDLTNLHLHLAAAAVWHLAP